MLKFTVTIDTDDAIGAKEEIAARLEDIGRVEFPKVEQLKIGEKEWTQSNS